MHAFPLMYWISLVLFFSMDLHTLLVPGLPNWLNTNNIVVHRLSFSRYYMCESVWMFTLYIFFLIYFYSNAFLCSQNKCQNPIRSKCPKWNFQCSLWMHKKLIFFFLSVIFIYMSLCDYFYSTRNTYLSYWGEEKKEKKKRTD